LQAVHRGALRVPEAWSQHLTGLFLLDVGAIEKKTDYRTVCGLLLETGLLFFTLLCDMRFTLAAACAVQKQTELINRWMFFERGRQLFHMRAVWTHRQQAHL
jgi:DNA mismatch repair ATPase MutL